MWQTRVLPRGFLQGCRLEKNKQNGVQNYLKYMSEANIGFFHQVSVLYSRQGLLEPFFESDHENEDDSSDFDKMKNDISSFILSLMLF